jgi:hypothetical protein
MNQSTRRCSYCCQEGHSVHQCNSEVLIELRKMCFCQRILFDYKQQSRADFQQWFMELSQMSPHEVLAFTARFCNVPTRLDFIDRMEIAANYIYSFPANQLRQEANPENNPWTNLALQNMNVLRDMDLFSDRLDFLLETREAIMKHQEKIKVKIVLQKEEEEEHLESGSECSICYEEKSKTHQARLGCGHTFCGDCIVKTMNTSNKTPVRCSLCRETITTIIVHNVDLEAEMRKI